MSDRKVFLTLALDEHLHARLYERAREVRRSMSYLLRLAIAEHMQRPLDPAVKRELTLLYGEEPTRARRGA